MMKNLLMCIAGTGLLFLSLGRVQAAPQEEHERWYQERDTYYHGEGWHARFFERVRQDLASRGGKHDAGRKILKRLNEERDPT